VKPHRISKHHVTMAFSGKGQPGEHPVGDTQEQMIVIALAGRVDTGLSVQP
jgi:hypothetical protein